jgi:tetrahydromethanopterin S-methyltransferase subunit G
MEEYITRVEFERQIAQLREEMRHRQTDEIPAVNVNVGSQDVLDRLDELKQELHTVSNTWLETLQEHYTEHTEAISDVKTVQSGHSKFFEEHGKRLAVTATKEDLNKLGTIMVTKDDISGIDSRLDDQGKKVDQMFQILQELQEKLGG